MLIEVLDSEGKVSRSNSLLVVSIERNRKEVEWYLNKLKKLGEPYLFTKEDRTFVTPEGEKSQARFYNLYTTSSLFTGAS